MNEKKAMTENGPKQQLSVVWAIGNPFFFTHLFQLLTNVLPL